VDSVAIGQEQGAEMLDQSQHARNCPSGPHMLTARPCVHHREIFAIDLQASKNSALAGEYVGTVRLERAPATSSVLPAE